MITVRCSHVHSATAGSIVHCVTTGFGEGGRYGNGLLSPEDGGNSKVSSWILSVMYHTTAV